MALYLGTQKISGLVTEYSTTTTSTNDATAVAADILQGKTAYTATGKTAGSLKISNIFIATSAGEPPNVIGSDGDIYLILEE